MTGQGKQATTATERLSSNYDNTNTNTDILIAHSSPKKHIHVILQYNDKYF